MVEAVLRDLDPPELVAPVVRRIAPSGFVTEAVLARLVVRLRRHVLAVDDPLLLDLGCGAGGLGLWLAEQCRTRLVGIDLDGAAIRRARGLRTGFGLAYEPTFYAAAFEWTGLAPQIVDAIVSIDALHTAADRASALAEARRVLVPGGVLMFDVYVDERDRHAWQWARALLAAGFDLLELDDETDAWRAAMERKHRTRLRASGYLIRRLGPALAADELSRSRRVLGLDGGVGFARTRRLELVAMSRG